MGTTQRVESFVQWAESEALLQLETARGWLDLSEPQTLRLERLLARALDAFGEEENAFEWVKRPLGVLEGRSPAQMAVASEHALQKALDVITRVEYGVYS